MKKFSAFEVKAALDHADGGGVALHVWSPRQPTEGIPSCFAHAALLGNDWGHLIDRDHERLRNTARQCGVKRIVVKRKGQRGQHVDLCGKPLARAIAKAGEESDAV